MKGYFVTGSDTGVGKTAVAAALCLLLRRRGTDAVPVKPVQTGVAPGEPGDLEHCLEVIGLRPGADDLALMNPCRFRLPASPHLAAEQENTVVDISLLEKCCRELAARHDMLIVEGAGGLLAPLRREMTTLDFAARLDLPLIIVARAGLGTINHSLLTVRAAREAGVEVACVVLNRSQSEPPGEDEKKIEADNVRIIAELGGVEVLGPLPHVPGAGEDVAATRKLAAQLANIFPADSITL